MYPIHKPHRDRHINVSISIIHNHQELETIHCPSAGEQFNGWWPGHTMKYSSAIKRTKGQLRSAWTVVQCVMQSETLPTQKLRGVIYIRFWKRQNHRVENPSADARCTGWRGGDHEGAQGDL